MEVNDKFKIPAALTPNKSPIEEEGGPQNRSGRGREEKHPCPCPGKLPPFQLSDSIIIIIIITRKGVIISCISWYLRFVVVLNGEEDNVFSIMETETSICE
jgi:hypothetical protein